MTRLTKRISRECVDASLQGRKLVITLCPPDDVHRTDTILLRQKGCRKCWRVPVDACLWLAAKAEARELAKTKALAKHERQAARRARA